ncbi:MAG: MBL fold metallo-hydrolase [Gammaproteobacteria bacterium]|tara:strand:+ start:5518 stop:6147 length:630 start_codon:yes stop_codon:yes gene_type:complete
MQVINTPISPYVQNAPIAYCEETKESIYIDPGDELDKLIAVQEGLDLKPQYIFITHGHIDHAAAAKELADMYDLKIIGPHIDDNFLLQALEIQGQMYNMKAQNFTPDQWLKEGDTLRFGNQILDIKHCPGHAPGHVIAINNNAKKVIAGDVLFNGSIGRTDLPQGNHKDLVDSIHKHLLVLDDSFTVHCGHGPDTTIGHERKTNPFLNA